MTMQKALSRVPEVTIAFWIIKILATTVGETAADYLNFQLKFGLVNTSYVMSGILLMLLLNQFRLKRYVPSIYWIVVVFMSVTGTLITDSLIDIYNISLVTITIAFSIILSAIFGFWYLIEKTLAMHSINTAKRELFYWAAILFTFALGTATGDLLAETLKLGYTQAALIFSTAIAIITISYKCFKMNGILAFWLAYILTRPLGASVGDLLSQPTANGGFGLGTVVTSILFLVVIVAFVTLLTLNQKRQRNGKATTNS